MATFEGLAWLQPFSVPPGAYAKLSPNQMANATRYGTHRTYASAMQLYRQGERGADLYIVLSGAVQTHWADARSTCFCPGRAELLAVSNTTEATTQAIG